MARRRPPFIQVLAPAVALLGLTSACTGPGKRHDDGVASDGSGPDDTGADPEDTGQEGEGTDTGAQ